MFLVIRFQLKEKNMRLEYKIVAIRHWSKTSVTLQTNCSDPDAAIARFKKEFPGSHWLVVAV